LLFSYFLGRVFFLHGAGLGLQSSHPCLR
jgi:hypothetical protein